MHAPVSWLRELADVPADATGADIAAALVRVGLEEEGLSGGDLNGPIVVGRVLSVEPEPQKNGKTINWCRVDVGDHGQRVTEGKAQEIVCGAHNFTVGDLVVCVLPGGVLPGGFEISARKTYGHVSNGMICSALELGLGEDHDGIIVLSQLLGEEAAAALTPGDDAIELLGLADEVVEVNVTPDRGYCFSMRGIAREYALSTGSTFRDPADLHVAPADGEGYAVSVTDEAPIDGVLGCDRYVARTVRGVDTTASSPPWMTKRLTQLGMRPISLAVDVTNYVMMLLGQPLHAFDLSTLSGGVGTRRARPGEKLTTLDDVARALDPQDLVIVDGNDRPLAIAGVMGGESSEVTSSTTDVLIEAAHFDPISVARSSRRHKLTTEASKRFERGVDPAVAAAAAQLAVDLLVTHGGGTAGEGSTDVDQRPPGAAITFDTTLPTRYVGLDYPRDEVVGTLRAIGCVVTEGPGDATGAVGGADGQGSTVTVVPPSWRPDLANGPDLVEEVARVRGYDQIPSVLPTPRAGHGLTHGQRVRRVVANTLAQQGLVEVLTYPFVGTTLFDSLGYSPQDARRRTESLVNPLSDELPLMRTSVLDTLLEALRRNVARGQRDVAVYELGLVTIGREEPANAPVPGIEAKPDDETLTRIRAAVPDQPRHVAMAAAGDVERGGPWGPGRRVDASDAVAWALSVGTALGLELVVAATERAPWHPGRVAGIALPDGTLVGHAGELHPKVTSALDLPARTVAAELDVDVLVAATGVPLQATELSTYPPAHTDVALVVAEDVPAVHVEDALRAGAGDRLESLQLFDIYRGEQVGEGHKSLAYRLTFRAAERTLTTDEVSALRDAAVAAAGQRTGAVQR